MITQITNLKAMDYVESLIRDVQIAGLCAKSSDQEPSISASVQLTIKQEHFMRIL